MTNSEIVENLQAMLVKVQELASLKDPSLEGDIQIILAILVDKLRNLDPLGYYPHQVDYE